MSIPTKSEVLFERFCVENDLDSHRIPEGSGKSPDYEIRFGGVTVAFEIKQLQEMRGFNPGGVSSRIPGESIRCCINDAKSQIQVSARQGVPAVLLIYNALDPWQIFATEPHDFISAMYGEITLPFQEGRLGPYFHGRNSRVRADMNTSFSAIGHLRDIHDRVEVVLYENVHSRNPLPFDGLPSCIEMLRIELVDRD